MWISDFTAFYVHRQFFF